MLSKELRNLKLVLLGLTFALALHGRGLLAINLTNLASVELLKALSCDSNWFICARSSSLQLYPPVLTSGNAPSLERAVALLSLARRLDGTQQGTRLRMAEAQFALGHRDEAATLIYSESLIEWPHPPGGLWFVPPARSPLLIEGYYGFYLIRARHHVRAGRWKEAVQDYRFGLYYGAERTLPIDERDFFMAMAELHRQHAEESPKAVYLTGKYLAKADYWQDAEPWLQRAVSEADKLTQEERGRAYLWLGKSLEGRGRQAEAKTAYQRVTEVAPQLREAYEHLLSLMRGTGEDPREVEEALLSLGPSHRLEIEMEGLSKPTCAVLPGGWRLAGFDLDEEALESGPPIDLLLWWEAPAGNRDSGQGIRVGPYLLAWQHVTNLAPNAGFEWGVSEKGLPLGYAGEAYGADLRAISLQPVQRSGRNNVALVVDGKIAPDIDIYADPILVDWNSLYLQGAWILSASFGKTARGCEDGMGMDWVHGVHSSYPHPYGWVFYADVAPPTEQQPVTKCSLVLMVNSSDEVVAFDDVIFARLRIPSGD